ncbi:uncharacterized protein PGTG_19258 [Puccinia graminis f. sp. tritici CRL 75-36-700-3]|uniref:Uncharacterized protein n=1 Tax=Puccinia graminis f. sp. tritici (strain CRL 75-36-700-3 / race SCCL) TaxID=418459 RepID=E3LA62_PUCGT|nr:uncharacterized protein PGTG_19258 [Puccinia graminis f. sp. tritici CRL 75-36-700-3]EFP93455.2 hypothetical protein PGTG_19258 [Puccinia graminis f. sp. tritici CRL 75-36-700-3]
MALAPVSLCQNQPTTTISPHVHHFPFTSITTAHSPRNKIVSLVISLIDITQSHQSSYNMPIATGDSRAPQGSKTLKNRGFRRGVELAVAIQKRHRVADTVDLKKRLVAETVEVTSTEQRSLSSSDSEWDDSSESSDSSEGQSACAAQESLDNNNLNATGRHECESSEVIESGSCGVGNLFQKDSEAIYDCSSLYRKQLVHSHPAILHLCLFSAICHVLEHCSVATSSFILKAQADFITILLSRGLDDQKSHTLSNSEQKILKSIPVDIHTVLGWLQISPRLNCFVCCSSCFALYPNKQTAPEHCTYLYIQKKLPDGPDLPPNDERTVCGQPLFKNTSSNFPTRTPVRQYATQDLSDWLARLLSRPGIEDVLASTATKSQKPYDPSYVSDIQESRVWKEFLGPNGQQFTSQSSNLVEFSSCSAHSMRLRKNTADQSPQDLPDERYSSNVQESRKL